MVISCCFSDEVLAGETKGELTLILKRPKSLNILSDCYN
jgi:hypothetical protein